MPDQSKAAAARNSDSRHVLTRMPRRGQGRAPQQRTFDSTCGKFYWLLLNPKVLDYTTFDASARFSMSMLEQLEFSVYHRLLERIR